MPSEFFVDPFGGFKQGNEQLRQTVGTIAQIEQGAKRLQLEERRIEQAEATGKQNIETAKTNIDISKSKLLFEAGDYEGAADVFNNSPTLNPEGIKRTFKGVFKGKVTYEEDSGNIIKVDQNNPKNSEVILAKDIKGSEEAVSARKKSKEEGIRSEAKIKKEVAGPSFSTRANEIARQFDLTDFGAANKEQAKAINEIIAREKETAGTGLQKGTLAKLEEDIKAGQQNILQFDRIEKMFNPKFLTLAGKAGIAIERVKDFLNIEGLPADKELLRARRKWFQASKNAFLRYRKWVTGVAGGEKEFAEIAKAFIDTDDTTPTEFAASLEEARDWIKIVTRWAENAKAVGFESLEIASANGVTITDAMAELEASGELSAATIEPEPNNEQSDAQTELDTFLQGGAQ